MALVNCAECRKEISASASSCPHCGFERTQKKKKGFGCGGWLAIMLFTAAIIGAVTGPTGTGTNASSPRVDPVAESVKNIKLDKFSWRTGGFDTVMIASFTLTNGNAHTVRDMAIACDLIAPSGTKIAHTSKVLHQKIEPKRSLRVNEFTMGFIHSQSAQASCRITDLVAH